MPNTRFQTAKMSHEDIRSALSQVLRKREGDSVDKLCWVDEVWDGHFIYQQWDGEGKTHIFKQTYSIGADDTVTLTGDPVEVEEAYVKKGTVDVVASNVVTGTSALEILAGLRNTNPLVASIENSGNAHLVVLDLTTIGKASQHQGPVQFLLERSGLEAAAPTIITKPVHVTQKYDGHVDANRAPVSVGTFIGYVPIDNQDGTVTFRTVASLWKKDYPEIVDEIQANKAVLGASYEIEYDPRSAKRDASVMRISNYAFSGGAILMKGAAAHPETAVLFADAYQVFDCDEPTWLRLRAAFAGRTELTEADTLSTKERSGLSDSDFALIQKVEDQRSGGTRKVRRFPIHDEAHRKNAWARVNQSATDLTDAERSQVRDRIMSKAKAAGDDWAKGYTKSGGKWVKSTQGGTRMSKYAGIPDELEALVDTIVANKTMALETKLTATVDAAAKDKESMQEMKKECAAKAEALVTAQNSIGALEAKKTAIEAETVTLKAELKTFQDKAAEAELKTKIDEQWASLMAEFKLPEESRASKAPLLEKLVAGKIPLTPAEWKELSSGGAPLNANPLSHTLHAGAGGGQSATPDPKRIAVNFPAATARADKRPMFK